MNSKSINFNKKTKRSRFHSRISTGFDQSSSSTSGRASNMPRMRSYRTIEDYTHALANSI